MKLLAGPLAGLVLFLLVILGFGMFHIVPPGHRGIAVRLGTVDAVQRPEGLTWKTPFVEQIIDFPIMQLKSDGTALSFSSDLQTLRVSYSVMYRIPESKVVTLFREYKGDPYINVLEPRIQETVKQVTALHRAEDFVKNRESVKAQILETLRKAIADLITIQDLAITNIDLSDQLEHAIEQKVVREQEALAKQFELDKEKRQAEITIVRAEAEAKSVQIRGDALKSSPEVIELEIAQKWDGKAPNTVVVGPGRANVLLPLK